VSKQLGSKQLGIAAVCVLLGGCTMLESVSHLATGDVPKAWSQPALSTDKTWPDSNWWQGFQSPELDVVIETARAQNLDLAIAKARVEQADAQARIVGSSLLPTLTGNVRANESGGIHDPSSTPVKTLTATAAVSYELDFWGRNFENARAANKSLAASEFDRETVALTTVSSVANSYFRLLSLRDRLRVSRLNVDNAAKLLSLTQKQLDAGVVSRLPVAQQTSLLASLRAQAANLELQERQTFGTLAVLLGKPPQDFVVAAQSLDGILSPKVGPGLTSELLARRPDVKSAEANLQAAQADLAAARAAYLPTISLTGSAGVTSTALAGLVNGSGAAYTIGASLLQNIFRGGELIAQNDRAYYRREELLASYRKSALNAFADVDAALVGVSAATLQEEQQAIAAASAAEALHIAEVQYKAGTADFLSVLSAQQTLYSAQDQLAQTRATRLQATVGLFRALGGGWSAPD
jgi:NodT family efflux transporter outer membrane factor (OMF) lipoprotein